MQNPANILYTFLDFKLYNILIGINIYFFDKMPKISAYRFSNTFATHFAQKFKTIKKNSLSHINEIIDRYCLHI